MVSPPYETTTVNVSSRNQYLSVQSVKSDSHLSMLGAYDNRFVEDNVAVADIIALSKQSLTRDGFVVDYVEVKMPRRYNRLVMRIIKALY